VNFYFACKVFSPYIFYKTRENDLLLFIIIAINKNPAPAATAGSYTSEFYNYPVSHSLQQFSFFH
jgi:hypothetical protein